MDSNVLSNNLRRFRIEHNLTQEGLADMLNISPQSVSRWECGTTMPDVLMLPKIAEIYGITIDSLYRKKSIAYDNYAQRLASIYEVTRLPEDFLRADMEFQKLIKSGELSTRDKFDYAYIFHEMLFYCKEKALEWYDSALADGAGSDPQSYSRCRSLKATLLAEFGKGNELLTEQLLKMSENSDADDWDYIIELYLNIKQHGEAYECFKKASLKFPDYWKLYLGGAWACVGLKEYEKALLLFQKAGELGAEFHSDLVGMAECYDSMGEYQKAIDIEQKLYDLYMDEGYEYEARICLQYIEELKIKQEN